MTLAVDREDTTAACGIKGLGRMVQQCVSVCVRVSTETGELSLKVLCDQRNRQQDGAIESVWNTKGSCYNTQDVMWLLVIHRLWQFLQSFLCPHLYFYCNCVYIGVWVIPSRACLLPVCLPVNTCPPPHCFLSSLPLCLPYFYSFPANNRHANVCVGFQSGWC